MVVSKNKKIYIEPFFACFIFSADWIQITCALQSTEICSPSTMRSHRPHMIDPSIPPSSAPLSLSGSLGSNPGVLGERQSPPWMSRQFNTGPNRRQPPTLTFTPTVKFEQPVHLNPKCACRWTVGGSWIQFCLILWKNWFVPERKKDIGRYHRRCDLCRLNYPAAVSLGGESRSANIWCMAECQ